MIQGAGFRDSGVTGFNVWSTRFRNQGSGGSVDSENTLGLMWIFRNVKQ